MSKYTLAEMYLGDRDTWSMLIYDWGRDNDLTSATVVLDMWLMVNGYPSTQKITDGVCSLQPGLTFTADSTTGISKFTANAHGLKDGYEVFLSNSGGALPTPLSSTTRYFVRDATPNTFRLGTEPNTVVTLTGNGTGTQTLKVYGQVTYAPTALDVDTAGIYKVLLTRTIGGKAVTFPDDKEGIAVVINAVP